MKNIVFLFVFLVLATNLLGQKEKKNLLSQNKNIQFKYQSLILPTALISYGFVGLGNDKIKLINTKIKENLAGEVHPKFKLDNISLFVPALSVYGLNALGIKGKNSFKDRSLILVTAYLLTGTTVLGVKKITAVERPDGSTKNSFPSGHTASAFAGAEFLFQEFRDVSIWYGVAGYAVAAGTGFLRIYNNRHWFTDVITGAGIGILSTKIAYWIYPFVNKTIFKNKKNITGSVIPFYLEKKYGLGLTLSF